MKQISFLFWVIALACFVSTSALAGSIPLRDLSLGMDRAMVEALGAKPDKAGRLLLQGVTTGAQTWTVEFTFEEKKVSEFALGAKFNRAHFDAAIAAVRSMGYAPAQFVLGVPDSDFVRVNGMKESEKELQARFEAFLHSLKEPTQEVTILFLPEKALAAAANLTWLEMQTRMGNMPVFMLHKEQDGLMVLACLRFEDLVARITRPI